MSSVKRVAATALFLVFALVLVSRPLLTNLAVLGQFGGGVTDRQMLLLVALLGVPVLLVVTVRLKSLRHEDKSDSGRSRGEWNADPRTTDSREQREQPQTAGDTGGEQRSDPADDQDTPTVPAFLSGQGGARDKQFEIEAQTPDAELSDHLEHLRAELDDPESQRELDRLEDVVAEHGERTRIPARCPQEHCAAAWSERGITGAWTGRYERLDDDRVICLECEQVYTLE